MRASEHSPALRERSSAVHNSRPLLALTEQLIPLVLAYAASIPGYLCKQEGEAAKSQQRGRIREVRPYIAVRHTSFSVSLSNVMTKPKFGFAIQ